VEGIQKWAGRGTKNPCGERLPYGLYGSQGWVQGYIPTDPGRRGCFSDGLHCGKEKGDEIIYVK